jgi:hypothetical protein
MHKINKLLIALVSTVAFFYISGIIFMISYDDSIIGDPIVGETANKIFSALFRWPYIRNYQINGDVSGDSNGGVNNFLFYLRPVDKSLKNENILIGYFDDLNYYKDDIKIHIDAIKDNFAKQIISSPSRNYLIKIVFPNTVFNIKKRSKGKNLEIFGLNPFAVKEIFGGSYKLKIFEGELNSIGFRVIPDNNFVKNHKIIIQILPNVYGSIIFLTNDKGQKIFVIHYMEKISDSKSYQPYLENFLKLLCEIELKSTIKNWE